MAKPGVETSSHWRWLLLLRRNSTLTNPASTPEPPCETKVIWLEKFLPDVVPNARIMSFGYQSNYMKSASKAGYQQLCSGTSERPY
jgi:hypothetical protein